jgi:hypothetical protein
VIFRRIDFFYHGEVMTWSRSDHHLMTNGVNRTERLTIEKDEKQVTRIEHDNYIWNFVELKYKNNNNNNEIIDETQFNNKQKELVNADDKNRLDILQ